MTIAPPTRTIGRPDQDWLADPIDQYRPDDFLMSSGRGTILARGSRRLTVHPADARGMLADLFADVGEAEPGPHGGGTLVAGALPFAPGRPGEFLVARSVLQGPRLHATAPAEHAAPRAEQPGRAPRTVPETTARQYTAAVAEALRRFTPAGLHKVVLARSQRLQLLAPLDRRELLVRLIQQNPAAHVFAAPLPGGRTLVGASPELLVRRTGRRAVSNPLAGSTPCSADPVLDRERAAALQNSAKDLREHRIVVDMVAEVLGRHCTGLSVPRTPELVRTGTMWHLSTRIGGDLRDPETSSLELAFALHPTPAVCGWPTDVASELIAELEPVDRGFYAGAVGWSNASGDGEWAVSIRCAELSADETGHDVVRLHAGAGIVPGSDPADELAETAAKFRTMLRGMGIDE